MNDIVYTVIFWPFIEYSIHYLLHIYGERRHKDHHIYVHSKKYRNLTLFTELEYFYYIIPIVLYIGYTKLCMCLLWYFSVHSIIHFRPTMIPILSKHHMLHHRYPNYNYGICTTYIDRLFGTLKKSD